MLDLWRLRDTSISNPFLNNTFVFFSYTEWRSLYNFDLTFRCHLNSNSSCVIIYVFRFSITVRSPLIDRSKEIRFLLLYINGLRSIERKVWGPLNYFRRSNWTLYTRHKCGKADSLVLKGEVEISSFPMFSFKLRLKYLDIYILDITGELNGVITSRLSKFVTNLQHLVDTNESFDPYLKI